MSADEIFKARASAYVFVAIGYIFALFIVVQDNPLLPHGLPYGLSVKIWLETLSGEIVVRLLTQALGYCIIPIVISALIANVLRKYINEIPKFTTFSIYFVLILAVMAVVELAH